MSAKFLQVYQKGQFDFYMYPPCPTKIKVLVTNHLQNPKTPVFIRESLFSFPVGSTSEGVTSLLELFGLDLSQLFLLWEQEVQGPVTCLGQLIGQLK